MSWSIGFIGNPENVVKALEENSAKLNGASKEEYDAALPHIIGIVKENFNPTTQPVLKVDASGSGYNRQRQCTVQVQSFYGQLV